MRAVVQRVSRASVTVDQKVCGAIGKGFLVLLGVGDQDSEEDLFYLEKKVAELRVFEDHEGKMNRSILEEGGEILVISQFTLYGDARKGRRPSYSHAARPEIAKSLYLKFCEALRARGIKVEEGVFQEHMDVELVNDGPVTILIDSKRGF